MISLKSLLYKIPRPLKSKTVLILISVLFLFFLLAPLSVIQINRKVSNIINKQAEQGILNFEKQTGLKIRWESLNFNLLLFRVELKEVFISNAFNAASKKNLLFDFLNGPQFLTEVSLRPRIFYSFFKKTIHLSSVKVQGGEFQLKTSPLVQKKPQEDKTLNLPVQRLFITDTHLQIQHKENELDFSHITLNIRQTGFGNYKFWSTVKTARINQTDSFEFQAKGRTSGNQLFMKHISLKNRETDIQVPLLNLSFDQNGVQRAETKSAGIIFSPLIEQAAQLFNQKSLPIKGIFSYDLHFIFKRHQGFQGNFSIHSKSPIVWNVPLKAISLQGKIDRNTLVAHGGSIEMEDQAKIQIKNLKIFHETKTAKPAFILSVNTNNLSVDFIMKNVFKTDSFSPVSSLFSGPLNCAGVVDLSHINCKGSLQSPKTVIQSKQGPVVFFHGMQVDLDGTWKDTALDFNFSAHKDDTTLLNGLGQYSRSEKNFSLTLNGFSLLKEDTEFAVPFSMDGLVQVTNGIFKVRKNKFTMDGLISSGNLTMDRYNIKNVTGSAQIRNDVLSFQNIKGRTGKSIYNGTVITNFTEKKVEVKINSSFFDMKNLGTIFGRDNNVSSSFRITGTGEGSFEIILPFSKKKSRDFHLKGHLFNAQIDKEFFPGIDFDILFQNNAGNIRSLIFRKGKGSVSAQGHFDRDFNLNISLRGINIPLERIEFLNSLLLFNQSGIVSFSGQLKGPLTNPEFRGFGEITNAVFYTYPVDNSQLNIILNRKILSLSGNLMNELLLKELSYKFQEKNSLYIKTELYKWDFINLFLARTKKENLRDFSSKLTGDMELDIKDNKVSGLIKIDNLFVSQGNKWMQNKEPFSIHITPSVWTVTPVQLSHYNNKTLEIKNRENNGQTVSGYTYLELWSLWFPFLRLMEGEARIDFSMDKNLKSFKPEGKIAIQNGFLSLPPLAGFTDVNAIVKLLHNKITITQFDSLYGDGEVKGQGIIEYSYGKHPPIVNCVLNFSDSQINIPKGFYTRGSGSLTIAGNHVPYSIKGDYVIDSGNILREWAGTKEDDFINNNLFASKKENLDDSPFYLNLKIHAQKPLLIRNSIIRAPALGTLRIHGSLKNLLISGAIELAEDGPTGKSGVITFRDKEFEINTASVIFDNSPPDNPLLNVTAQTVLEAKATDSFLSDNQEITREYRIFLTAEGPSKNLKISLTSIPSLSKKEIVSLLAFGMTTQHFDENIKQNITQYSYQFLGSYLLQRPLGKELRDTLNLNLDIAPYLNTKSTEPAATKVTLKRNWLKNLQTSISRTLEEKPVSDARMKYNLKKNISLTAFWEDTEKTQEDGTGKDTIGLDLEFNFEF